MARSARPPRDRSDDDDDKFPDIATLFRQKQLQAQVPASATQKYSDKRPKLRAPAKAATAIRRRKLGPLADNLLLRAWTPSGDENERKERHSSSEKENTGPPRAVVGQRTRNVRPAVAMSSSPADQEEDYFSAREELTITEDASITDDVFTSSEPDSDFSGYEDEEDDDDDGDVFEDSPPRRSPAKPRFRLKQGRKGAEKFKKADKDLADATSRLRLDDDDEIEGNTNKVMDSRPSGREVTPPSTPPKPRPGLVSPRKLPRIPVTPHRPSSDVFWSQEFVDKWNDEHSPRKQLFPDATAARQGSPTKASPEKKSQKTTTGKTLSDRETKRTFEKTKHELAEQFVRELDTVITDGKLAELAASTGGIKLIWTNKLNTTAGRANWKYTTVRTRVPDGDVAAAKVEHKHFASIELAEKVIDNEHRLLNVLAHEFCHLANFMISRVTNNPHGREFKAWAAKCSRAFGHRGIEVTTKHSYEIDFKYVWECVACGVEYKRHSKSINPARHRCGSCKSELIQTKPVPRKPKEGRAPGKLSEYQMFMKEQMSVVREENQKMSQKEIMKIVAGRWAAQRSKSSTPDEGVQEVAKDIGVPGA
ncbi:SprT-like family-domain-containing protein [Achaetomium macrosporum]|uniref:SprT-like family-domain-containing protein n=1 Tax=Achaetomium macrosporum TaxID=79813 RepID=A0AAN7CIR7_9PEZI|nr:SprT-like family-domain-containing protein [Achaetomium macrosporum]